MGTRAPIRPWRGRRVGTGEIVVPEGTTKRGEGKKRVHATVRCPRGKPGYCQRIVIPKPTRMRAKPTARFQLPMPGIG